MEREILLDQEDHKLNRTYYMSPRERRHLKRTAKRIGLENPYIPDKDIYHDLGEFSNKEERKEIKKRGR